MADDDRPGEVRTALELLREHTGDVALVSFCERIDTLLDGGLQPRQTLELVGEPGSGKTALAMQLAVDAAIPAHFGGLAGSTLYIDTECAFDFERADALAHALAEHLAALSAESAGAATTPPPPPPPTADAIVRGIEVLRVHTFDELSTLLLALPHALRAREPPVRLIVLDSVAAPVRGEPALSHPAEHVRALAALAQRLRDAALALDAIVVVTNHITLAPPADALPPPPQQQQLARVPLLEACPALGERWRHWCDTRLLLHVDSVGERTARLLKGGPEQPVPFQITEDGVRDV